MLKREAQGHHFIHISKINSIIKWTVRIPKKYHNIILKELVELGLVIKCNKGRFDYIINHVNHKSPSDSLGHPLWD